MLLRTKIQNTFKNNPSQHRARVGIQYSINIEYVS